MASRIQIQLFSRLARFYSTDIVGVRLPIRLKQRADGESSRPFVDMRRICVVGGSGGDGCIAFERLFCNPCGGPSGGNGGNGGHVIFQANRKVVDLAAIPTICKAHNGTRGSGSNCHGASAKHQIIEIPVATQIHGDAGNNASEPTGLTTHRRDTTIGDDSSLLATLYKDGETFVAAHGGAGGRGNAFLASSKVTGGCRLRNAALRLAERGAAGESRRLVLRLPSFADVGLVGAPNAGKSTLLRRLTRARPKVAPYPFTTLHAQVGTLICPNAEIEGDCDPPPTVADLPGIVEGAAENNAGLGVKFLSLIEGCHLIIYVVDVGTAFSPAYHSTDLTDDAAFETGIAIATSQLRMLRSELALFNPQLVDPSLPSLVVGTKIDMLVSDCNGCGYHGFGNTFVSRLFERLQSVTVEVGFSRGAKETNVVLVSALRGDNIFQLAQFLKAMRN